MNKVVKLLAAMALSTFPASVFAVPIATVGSYDTQIASATLDNSGEGTEEIWIESVLGTDITYTQLSDIVSEGVNWEAVDGGVLGDYAFDFGSGIESAYFLVKVGGGSGTGTDDTHFLYENISIMQWGYISLADFGDVSLTDIAVISHAGITGGTSVPEPGMVGLLVIGILGMVITRRKLTI